MTFVAISDITLREENKLDGFSFSFKEKIEIARLLDQLKVNVIETAPITKGKTDILFLHSISPLIKNSVLSCPVELNEESVEITYNAIKDAKKPRLHIMVPVSTVQMEYNCHLKPAALLDTLKKITAKAKSLTDDVEVSLVDATRAEKDFLSDVINAACENGATTITICDSAGNMLPSEFETFLKNILDSTPALKNVNVSVECSDALHMASACAISCIRMGVSQIKAAIVSKNCTDIASIAHIFREKADALNVNTTINISVLDNTVNKIKRMTNNIGHSPFDNGTNVDITEKIELSADDDMTTISIAIKKLGYTLSDEDVHNVYEEFLKISKNKPVGAKELEAIIASVAMQVAPTYKLKSYVINNGNIISPTAHIELEKDGKILQGICIGDGPIDAAFLAIEQITGHHFELDDFQIQAVTEGREAMGSSIVKLRYNGKPYSGKGISTDIIGASINAYINALNKICFEEA